MWLCRIVHFFSLSFSLLLYSQISRGQVTILLKVTACLVFNVCFQRWSHSPLRFPTVLILHSECIIVFLSCPVWCKAIKPRMKQTGLWICRSGLCRFHQALLGGNILPGKPRASRRLLPPLLPTGLGRVWASPRSQREQALGAGPGESCVPHTALYWAFPNITEGLNPTRKILCEPKRKNKRQACLLQSVVKRKCILLWYKDSTAWDQTIS